MLLFIHKEKIYHEQTNEKHRIYKSGIQVAILEKRHVIGGAAVTEELVPGFHFSRASYLLALMRPEIIQELNLKKHGLKWFVREPHAFTPLLDDKRMVYWINSFYTVLSLRIISLR